jgi:hypothetical protein
VQDVEDDLDEGVGFEGVLDADVEEATEEEEEVEGAAEEAFVVLELFKDTPELSAELLLFWVLEAPMVLVYEVDAHDRGDYAEDHEGTCEDDVRYKVEGAKRRVVELEESREGEFEVSFEEEADEEAPLVAGRSVIELLCDLDVLGP